MELKRLRTFTLHRTQVPIQEEPEEHVNHSALDNPIYTCYVCGKVSSNMNVINKETRLAVCKKCDPLTPEETEHRHIKSKAFSLIRQAKRPEIAPEDALCAICNKEIINEQRLRRKAKRLIEHEMSDKDKERLESQIKHEGWKFIGNGKYAHNRCLKKNIRRK